MMLKNTAIKNLQIKIVKIITLLISVRLVEQIPLINIGFTSRQDNAQRILFRTLLGIEFLSYGSLGIAPYLNSSLLIQAFTPLVPVVMRLQEEGNFGRQRVKQYTRVLTVLNSLILGFIVAMKTIKPVIFGWKYYIAWSVITSLMGGGMIHMYTADRIATEKLGNGTSLMLCTSIIGGFSVRFSQVYEQFIAFSQTGKITTYVSVFVGLGTLIYFVTYGQRKYKKISIASTKPLDIVSKYSSIYLGMLPVPYLMTGVLPLVAGITIAKFGEKIMSQLTLASFTNLFAFRALVFSIITMVSSTLFTTFVIAPQKISNNLSRAGCVLLRKQADVINRSIEYIRPGTRTKKYLAINIARVGFAGGIGLVILSFIFTVPERSLGFQLISPIIILIAALTETVLEIQSYLLTTRYERFS